MELTARWTNLIQDGAVYDKSRQLAGSGDALLLEFVTFSGPCAILVPDILEFNASVS